MTTNFVPQVAVIDFNHHRGPEIEFWADPAGEKLNSANEWSHLPFLALPDGAHASSEEFSYFTLLSKTPGDLNDTSLFGISCTRQIRADKLKAKSSEVTRSFVQKAVVAIVNNPGDLGQVRERLAAVTAAWFAQEDFSNVEILKVDNKKDGKEAYFGLSLRELIYDLRWQTLVLFKCLLLQKRALFFGTRCERLCMTQFTLVSLIPHLLESLQDCASPELNAHAQKISRATELRTILAYIGLPLQIFGEGSFFSPYTPLQQLDSLSAPISKSYVAGSTNTLFLSQRELVNDSESKHRYCDVIVNLDESAPANKITVLEPSLRAALNLTAADRRWIDHLTQTVVDTWNPNDPSRPTTHGYQGSEDAIRLSFEEYILSFLSSVAYKSHFDNHPNPYLSSTTGGVSDERYPDPLETANDFNHDFIAHWKVTPNYKLWHNLTSDAGIFDIVEPRHPTAGGLNIEDVQRRVGAAMQELHIDDKVRQGRETAGKALEAGRERVGAGVARFWKEVEGFKERREQSRARGEKEKENDKPRTSTGDREESHPDVFDASRKSAENPSTIAATNTAATPADTNTAAGSGWTAALRSRAAQVQRPNVDTAQVQAAARENAAKAGAYLSSWGSWASKKTQEWQEARAQGSVQPPSVSTTEVGNQQSPQQGIQRQATVGAVAAAKSAMGAPRQSSEKK
ncbi:hypothetical protein OHC33_009673 [Knufia fluminis]|uniref:UDENN domain-containing protein n=1 Tax=Knufia fluminis TaxID=191047 RepID=A0AAN8EGV4_9EURO|nr:hypothetical protein OHC33_009673 [Knufia fluminis]